MFVFEYFDSTIGTPQKVWSKLSLKTLGVVPNFHALTRDKIDRVRPAQLIDLIEARNSAFPHRLLCPLQKSLSLFIIRSPSWQNLTERLEPLYSFINPTNRQKSF